MSSIISSGGRFHYDRLAREAAIDATLGELWIGVPLSRMVSVPGRVRPLLFPTAVWRLAQKTGPLRDIHEIHHLLYDKMASRRVSTAKPPRLVHAAAGYGRQTLERAKALGSFTVIDRSCPHTKAQKDLLEEEAALVRAPVSVVRPRVQEMMEEEYEIADRIIVPSRFSAESFDPYPHLKSKLRIVQLGFDARPTPPVPRSSGGDRQVLFVGGNALRKGLKWLIDAWKLLDPPNATLRLRTEMPEWLKPELKGMSGIEIVPPLSKADLMAEYDRADVTVLPSVDDGFGMSLLEGMSHGAVGVFTDHVGAGEYISGPGAIRVPIRDPEKLAAALQELLEDPDLYDRGLAAREASLPLTWTACYEAVRSVWNEAERGSLRG